MLWMNVLPCCETLEDRDGESQELHGKAVRGNTPMKYFHARSSIRDNDMTLRRLPEG